MLLFVQKKHGGVIIDVCFYSEKDFIKNCIIVELQFLLITLLLLLLLLFLLLFLYFHIHIASNIR
jgi:hypothetical protein